jgi:aminopeptidase N
VKTKLVALIATLVLVAGTVVTVLALAVRDDDGQARAGAPASATTSPETSSPSASKQAYEAALSTPVEDSVYPNVGDPGVDALHYDLDLAWDRESRTLDGTATVSFRSTRTSPQFRLDLGESLAIGAVTMDGAEVPAEHNGKDLVVTAPVVANARYVLTVEYSGSPEPVEAPSTRSDVENVGFTVTPEGEVWTMQSPYGAFTWYPVNDQPSDKALYDFTITAPADWVGVANGELEGRSVRDGTTITEWHLGDPTSSYLVTIAIGDFVMTEDETTSGVPITYWTPRGDSAAVDAMRVTPDAIEWIEQKLGPYPFSTLGSVVVDSASAMETQTMVTYGNTFYTLSEQVVVHELVHQWYGDIVSPSDWRDVWMNEGMTLYLAEGVWNAETNNLDLDVVMDDFAAREKGMRADAGPPGDYDPRMFGDGNIYYGPAVMWHELRLEIGEEKFWAMVRAWPTEHAEGNPTREQYLDWIEEETGEELTAFFDAWLMGETSPRRG